MARQGDGSEAYNCPNCGLPTEPGFICTFERETDAKRFREVLTKSLGRYSLELAEKKTKFKLKRRTSAKKFGAKVRELKDWFRTQLTTPISIVWPTLVRKIQGHFQYFNVNDNWASREYCDITRRNPWQTVNTNPILNSKDPELLAPSRA